MLLAVLPVVGYLGLLAAIRLSGRALVSTSARDTIALSMAMAGFFAVGPAQLFFPTTAALVYGPAVWLVIGVLYALLTLLITLGRRPSLVIYGRTPAEVYPALLAVAIEIDPDASGDPTSLQINLPGAAVQLLCDGSGGNDFTKVVSFRPLWNHAFWNRLMIELRRNPIPMDRDRTRGGGFELGLAAAIGLAALWYALSDPGRVMEEFRRWLFR